MATTLWPGPAALPGAQRPESREWTSLGGMAAFIMLLHVVGWGVLVGIVAPEHYQVGASQVFGVGLGRDRLHARACGTPSTPTTSPPSTTPPAS